MKQLIVLCVLMFPTMACAFDVQFSQTPVYGTVGDSYMNDQPPINSGFGGVLLAGGSNGSFTKALTQLGVRTHTTAQAGATSFDQLDEAGNIVFYGLEEQLTQLLKQTTWFDGTSRLDTVIIGPTMNDFSHTRIFSHDKMNEYIDISVHVAQRALDAGKKVVYILPPKYDKLHLKEAIEFYENLSGQHMGYINETDYNVWRNKNIAAMCSVPGVRCVDALKDMSTQDGLHPTYGSYLSGAEMVLEDNQ